ncbi:Membrane protein involved in the export of O-antigen and teichoic acid [Butyrivibrio hungatei DSM 14810]|uniref:Membrane protein involved in the export of O-antigen and teichoic acid n=1 Tax=Butyrivibrio hungatei DSM 14810 TaxID=1121132 RepID=A0A1M7T5D2_9FIRM|nr:oligosaccharide flippase family protein [Butyrivibrio hungatei]SHN65878.1 Membrane protein involved in the export of O-antigen and teichoic acid [Butyrivibrio hungatei DSM 14810]
MNKIWIKNISYTLCGKIMAMIASVVTDIVIARLLEIQSYAEWTFFFSILTMLNWAGWLGINISSKVIVSKCTSDIEEAKCLKSARLVRFFFSVCIGIVLYVFLPRLAPLGGYPQKYPELKWLFSVACILVFFNSFVEFYKEIFMGVNKFKWLFLITTAEYMGYFLFSTFFLFLNREIKSVVYGYVASGIVVFLIGYFGIYLNYRDKVVIGKNLLFEYVVPIMRYSIPIALLGMGVVILTEMDTFMLGIFSTKENVAVYGIAKNICHKAAHLNNAFSSGIMTTFSVVTANNFMDRKSKYKNAERINIFITTLISAGLFLFSKATISILYGKSYLEAAHVINILIPYYFLFGISNFYSFFLDFRNKAGKRCVWYCSVVFLNMLLNRILIPKYGAEGAAIATSISLLPYTVYSYVASVKEWNEINYQIKNGGLQ